jgi:hypothetical protein
LDEETPSQTNENARTIGCGILHGDEEGLPGESGDGSRPLGKAGGSFRQAAGLSRLQFLGFTPSVIASRLVTPKIRI